MNGLEVKRRLHAQGKSLRQWADEHGYPYHLVSNVVRGINKGTFGKGYEVAIKLGMQSKPQKEAA